MLVYLKIPPSAFSATRVATGCLFSEAVWEMTTPATTTTAANAAAAATVAVISFIYAYLSTERWQLSAPDVRC